MKPQSLPFFTAALLTTASAVKVFDLGEANWILTSPGNESFQPVEGTVPSQAHLDLYAAGIIPDPYFGLNDFDLRWVAGSNWSYAANVEGL
jgi:beta-mannosidase